MDKIIFEVSDRVLNQYHVLQKFPVTIGRALDNDIILSDPAISPHHLVIHQTDDAQLTIQNLSSENGTQLNHKKLINNEAVATALPASLILATRECRLLSSNTAVARTAMSACQGAFSIFCRPLGAALLVIMTLIVVLLENYFNTEYEGAISTYLSKVLPSIWFLMAFSLLALGLSRLVVNRWELGPSVGVASLFVLAPHVLYEVGHWLSYFLTSDWPRNILLVVNGFVVLPVLLFVFIYRIYNVRANIALGLALLLSAPLLVFQATDLIDSWTVKDSSADELNFNRTVRAWDIRLLPTLPQADYIQQAREALGTSPEAKP